jgi:hypothetical protein
MYFYPVEKSYRFPGFLSWYINGNYRYAEQKKFLYRTASAPPWPVYGLQVEPVKLLSLSVIVNFSNTAVLLKFELVYLSRKQNLFRAD